MLPLVFQKARLGNPGEKRQGDSALCHSMIIDTEWLSVSLAVQVI